MDNPNIDNVQNNANISQETDTTLVISKGSQIKPGVIDPRHLVVPTTPHLGDIFYSNGTTFKILPPGSNGQVLALSSGIPAWTTTAVVPTNQFPTVTALSGTTPTATCTGLNNIIFTITLSGNTTYSISGAQAGQILMFEVKQGSGTTYTNTWFSGVTWVTSGAVAPVQTTTTNGYTTYGFRVLSSSTFLGYLVGSN